MAEQNVPIAFWILHQAYIVNTTRNNGQIIYNLLCMDIMLPPFSLVFRRDALSPETISLELAPMPLPHDDYAKHILSSLSEATNSSVKLKLTYVISSLKSMTRKLVI